MRYMPMRHALYVPQGMLFSLGTVLRSDSYFITWLLRVGITKKSFLRQMCCSVHQEFWLGVRNGAWLIVS